MIATVDSEQLKGLQDALDNALADLNKALKSLSVDPGNQSAMRLLQTSSNKLAAGKKALGEILERLKPVDIDPDR